MWVENASDQELIKRVVEIYEETEAFKRTTTALQNSTAKVRKALSDWQFQYELSFNDVSFVKIVKTGAKMLLLDKEMLI